jgi:hypothetical protein
MAGVLNKISSTETLKKSLEQNFILSEKVGTIFTPDNNETGRSEICPTIQSILSDFRVDHLHKAVTIL